MTSRVARAGFIGVALVVAGLALGADLLRTVGRWHGARARRHLYAERHENALHAATWASRFDPYGIEANYSGLVALKRLGRWAELAERARHLARWHPEGAPIMRLLGEAAWRLGSHEEAAEALWASFWREPAPPSSPGQLWRMTMLAGEKAWGPADRRVLAAALRTLTTMPRDERISEADRQAARRQAAEILERAGAPLSSLEILSRVPPRSDTSDPTEYENGG